MATSSSTLGVHDDHGAVVASSSLDLDPLGDIDSDAVEVSGVGDWVDLEEPLGSRRMRWRDFRVFALCTSKNFLFQKK
jgi:hypothetical protein